MGHDHAHHHSATGNIGVALTVNLFFTIIEFIGGIWTGSVAVLSDAVHDLGDTMSLAAAFVFEKKADRGSDLSFSYGYRRVSLFSALVTVSVLVVGSIWVLSAAIPRLFDPQQPNTGGMFVLALLGIGVNGYAAWKVSHGSTMNERVVSWHMIEDLLGWVAVLICSVIMMVADVPILDPLLSIGITLFVLWGVFKNLKETLFLFLQGVPRGTDWPGLQSRIRAIDGVQELHDAHLWSLDGERHVLTAHLVVSPDLGAGAVAAIKREVRHLASQVGTVQVTLEIETEGGTCATPSEPAVQ